MNDDNVSHNNQDIIYKYMTEFFKNETLEYYGLHLPKIVGVKPTELPAIQISDKNMDYVFELEDNSYLHMEFQTTHKKADLLRFLQYDVSLYTRDNKKIHTAVIYSGKFNKADKTLDIGSAYYMVEQVFMINYDGDERYGSIKNKIENNIPLDNKDIMDLVFLPLMKSEDNEDEVTIKALELASKIKDEKMQSLVIAATLGLADKYVREEYLNHLKEVIRMTRIGASLIEEGRKEGIKEGIKKGMNEGIRKGMNEGRKEAVLNAIKAKFGEVPDEIKDKIIKTDNENKLDEMLVAVIKSDTINELYKII